jgi:hypothetical protein
MACQQRAVLMITRQLDGTSSSVAKSRIELSCSLPEGHPGPHEDAEHGERWQDDGKPVTLLLRHEDEAEPGS